MAEADTASPQAAAAVSPQQEAAAVTSNDSSIPEKAASMVVVPIVEQRYHEGLQAHFLYIVDEERAPSKSTSSDNKREENHQHPLPLFLPWTERLLARLHLIADDDHPDNKSNHDHNEEQQQQLQEDEEDDLLGTTGVEEEEDPCSFPSSLALGGSNNKHANGNSSQQQQKAAGRDGDGGGQQRLGVFLETRTTTQDANYASSSECDEFYSCGSIDQGSSSRHLSGGNSISQATDCDDDDDYGDDDSDDASIPSGNNNNKTLSSSLSRLDDPSAATTTTTTTILIGHPEKNDIVLAKGFQQSVGNQHLWDLVLEQCSQYEDNPSERRAIKDEILLRLAQMQPPARFLRRNPQTRLWEIANTRRIMKRVENLFRQAIKLRNKNKGDNNNATTAAACTDTSSRAPTLKMSKVQLKTDELLHWLDIATVGSSLTLEDVTTANVDGGGDDGGGGGGGGGGVERQLSILCDMVNQTILASREVRLDHGRMPNSSSSYQVHMVPLSSPLLVLENVSPPLALSCSPTTVSADDPPPSKEDKKVWLQPDLPITPVVVQTTTTDPMLIQPTDPSHTIVRKEDCSKKQQQQTEEVDKETQRRLSLTPVHLRRLKRVYGLKKLMRDALKAIKWLDDSTKEEKGNQKGHKDDDDEYDDSAVVKNEQDSGGADTTMDEVIEKKLLPYDESWLRLIRSINSVAIVLPTLLNIVLHEYSDNTFIQLDKNNLELRQQATSNNKRKQISCCWLLGTNVYDICARADRVSVLDQLRTICKLLGLLTTATTTITTTTLEDGTTTTTAVKQRRDDDLTKIDWRGYLEPRMRHICEMSCMIHCFNNQQSKDGTTMLPHPSSGIFLDVVTNNHHHPWSGLVTGVAVSTSTKTLEELDALGHRMDVHYGFNSSSTQSESEMEKNRDFRTSVENLHKRVSYLLCKRFTQPETSLTIYGSCVSNLSPGRNVDVDMSLHLDRKKYYPMKSHKNVESSKSTTALLDKVSDVFRRRDDFTNIVTLTQTRIPVLKGKWKDAKNPYSPDGSLDFDICLWNEIAVANSMLIKEYCSMDERVPKICTVVKQWAKHHDIASAADKTLSTYTWVNLVLFYLQRIDFIPNLQSRDLLKQAGIRIPDKDKDKKEDANSLDNFDTFFMTWEQVRGFWKRPNCLETISVTALLFGFFDFYANHALPELFIIGIKRMPSEIIPKTAFSVQRRSSSTWFWTVEDPFETFDSRKPHNLGSHANGEGAQKIRRCVREANLHLKKLLESLLLDDDDNSIDLLPTHDLLLPLPLPPSHPSEEKYHKSQSSKKKENNNNNNNTSQSNRKKKSTKDENASRSSNSSRKSKNDGSSDLRKTRTTTSSSSGEKNKNDNENGSRTTTTPSTKQISTKDNDNGGSRTITSTEQSTNDDDESSALRAASTTNAEDRTSSRAATGTTKNSSTNDDDNDTSTALLASSTNISTKDAAATSSRSSTKKLTTNDDTSSRASTTKKQDTNDDNTSSRASTKKVRNDDTGSRASSKKSSSRSTSKKSRNDDTSSRASSKKSKSKEDNNNNERSLSRSNNKLKPDSSVPKLVTTGKNRSVKFDGQESAGAGSSLFEQEKHRRAAFYGGLGHGLLLGIVGTIVVLELMSSKGGRRRR